MGCFCCKTACFFLLGWLFGPQTSKAPRARSRKRRTLQVKQKNRRQAAASLGYCGNATNWRCWGIFVWVKLALPASHQWRLTNMQLWGPVAPETETLWCWAPTAQAGFCDGHFAQEVDLAAVWGEGQPYWELMLTADTWSGNDSALADYLVSWSLNIWKSC